MQAEQASADRPLAQRQQQLLAQSAQLRADLGRTWQALEPSLAVADRVRAGWLWLRAHPELPLAAAAALIVLRPRRAWRWGRRLWWGWHQWRRIRHWLQPVR